MGVTEQRIEVLRRVERGELSPEEGAILLGALERGQELPTFEPKPMPGEVRAAAVVEPVPPAGAAEERKPEQGEVLPSNFLTEAQIQRRKLIWLIPFLLGLLLTSLGGVWMVRGYQNHGLGWGFWLSWIPFLLGVGIMVLSWGMRRGCWLHVRIHQKPGSRPQKIDLSFPSPFGLPAGSSVISATAFPVCRINTWMRSSRRSRPGSPQKPPWWCRLMKTMSRLKSGLNARKIRP